MCLLLKNRKSEGIVAFFVMFFCLVIMSITNSACKTLPDDIAPNFTTLNYFNLEMLLSHMNNSGRFIGTAPLYMEEGDTLDRSYIDLATFLEGVVHVYSDDCQINFSKAYNGPLHIPLKDIIDHPRNCTIILHNKLGKIGNNETNISEIGKIDVLLMPKKTAPIMFTYKKVTSHGAITITQYAVAGYQLPEGQLTSQPYVELTTDSAFGLWSVNSSCPHVPPQSGAYNSHAFFIPLSVLYGKKFVDLKDNCNFFISVLPDEDNTIPFFGRLDVSVYSKEVVPLELPDAEISMGYLKVCGNDYVIGTQINNEFSKGCTKIKYRNNIEYILRMITKNGRKSVVGYKNGEYIIY